MSDRREQEAGIATEMNTRRNASAKKEQRAQETKLKQKKESERV